MPDFKSLFIASHGQPIEFAGHQLHARLRLELAPESRLHILFESSIHKPVQGICITADRPKHRLVVAGVSARSFVLWRDTAPNHDEVALPRARQQVPVTIYNVWRDEKYGTMMYGLNAAAMRITQEAPGKWLLECSDGWGTDADFGDLVVRVVEESSSSGAA